jgi:uncharacterized RmlC-like cupin family protein
MGTKTTVAENTVGAQGLSMRLVVIPLDGRAGRTSKNSYETGIYGLEGRVCSDA